MTDVRPAEVIRARAEDPEFEELLTRARRKLELDRGGATEERIEELIAEWSARGWSNRYLNRERPHL